MPDGDWFKYVQFGGTLIAGGMAGAVLNYFIAERKNRVQPVGMKITDSYVDLPEILKGYGATIALTNDGQSSLMHFNNIAVIRIELFNSGNKDLDSLKLGINLPENTEAIGFKGEGDDRYHTIENDKPISAVSGQSELNIEMKPFHRENRYVITIIANTVSRDIKKEIKLSKSIPIRFVDLETKEQPPSNRFQNYISVASLLIAAMATLLGSLTASKVAQYKKRETELSAMDSELSIILDRYPSGHNDSTIFKRYIERYDSLKQIRNNLNKNRPKE